jgi:hypothetical protein
VQSKKGLLQVPILLTVMKLDLQFWFLFILNQFGSEHYVLGEFNSAFRLQQGVLQVDLVAYFTKQLHLLQ